MSVRGPGLMNLDVMSLTKPANGQWLRVVVVVPFNPLRSALLTWFWNQNTLTDGVPER